MATDLLGREIEENEEALINAMKIIADVDTPITEAVEHLQEVLASPAKKKKKNQLMFGNPKMSDVCWFRPDFQKLDVFGSLTKISGGKHYLWVDKMNNVLNVLFKSFWIDQGYFPFQKSFALVSGDHRKRALLHHLHQSGVRLLYSTYSETQDEITCAVAVSDETLFFFDGGSVVVSSVDPEVLKKNNEIFYKYKQEDGGAYISILVKTAHGLDTRMLSIKERPFKESHYPVSVIPTLKKARSSILAKNPFGRITILTGPPGTGKTSFIRSLLTEKSGKFLLIPTALVSELQSCDLLPVLLNMRSEDKPTILVIEDADSALERRDAGNISKVGVLLNTVDGLLTDHLDLRVVATSNLDIANVDEALGRPGRLNAMINVGHLTPSECKGAYAEIAQSLVLKGLKVTPFEDIDIPARGLTIAELYEKSLGEAATIVNSEVKKTNPIGF